jgi:hypothetical protein
VFSCKRRDRREIQLFEVPDLSLVGAGTVSTGKTLLSGGKYCLDLQFRIVEE